MRSGKPAIKVSLFTREWIEISPYARDSVSSVVSLFTREWIEIVSFLLIASVKSSPSLRGSGLKYKNLI